MENIKLPHHHNSESVSRALKKELDDIKKFQKVANIFKQLDDSTRIRLFWLLCHCEECVINIAAMLDLSSPAVSHHLRILKESGLITSRRNGKEVYYKAADTDEVILLHKMIEQVIEITCPN